MCDTKTGKLDKLEFKHLFVLQFFFRKISSFALNFFFSFLHNNLIIVHTLINLHEKLKPNWNWNFQSVPFEFFSIFYFAFKNYFELICRERLTFSGTIATTLETETTKFSSQYTNGTKWEMKWKKNLSLIYESSYFSCCFIWLEFMCYILLY